MPTDKTSLQFTFLSTLFLLLGGSVNAASSIPVKAGVSIILTAFGDKDATFGETQPFLTALKNKVDRTAKSAFCKGVYEGNISGQSVVIVTTGSGSDNAGACMQELLYEYKSSIKEVIWSGIGGATPAVGGLVDRAGNMRKSAVPVMLGDVCISALAWNYDLNFSSAGDWADGVRKTGKRYDPAGGWWPMKNSDGKASVIGFENVQSFTIADKSLANELVEAAKRVPWPSLSSELQANARRYFGADQLRKVRVFDSSQCGEVAGNNFWLGVVEDRLARQYLANLVAVSGYAAKSTSEDDVVAFSAMEGAAWMSVVDRWNKHYRMNIPMALIRAASDYDHTPLAENGDKKQRTDGKSVTAMDDIMLGFNDASAAFAWNNAAQPVLELLKSRSH